MLHPFSMLHPLQHATLLTTPHPSLRPTPQARAPRAAARRSPKEEWRQELRARRATEDERARCLAVAARPWRPAAQVDRRAAAHAGARHPCPLPSPPPPPPPPSLTPSLLSPHTPPPPPTTTTTPALPTTISTASTLQVLDIVLKHHAASLPSRMAIAAGVFDQDADHLHKLLGQPGYADTELWFGHRQSVVHTESGPLLQVDLACTTMLAPIGTSPHIPSHSLTSPYNALHPLTSPHIALHRLTSPYIPIAPPLHPRTPLHPYTTSPHNPLQACSTSSV